MKLIDADKLKERLKCMPVRASKGFLKKAFEDLINDVVVIVDELPDEKRTKRKVGVTDGRECDVE